MANSVSILTLVLASLEQSKGHLQAYKKELANAKKLDKDVLLNALILPIENDLYNAEKWLREFMENKNEPTN